MACAGQTRVRHMKDACNTLTGSPRARAGEATVDFFFWYNFSGLQHDTIHNRQPFGVPLKEKLLPEYLRQLGYSTHAVGKVICFD